MYLRLLSSVFLLLATSFLLVGCGSTPAIVSTPASRTMEMDADIVEWVDHLDEYERGRLRLGVQNDDRYLYVAFVTPDRVLIDQIRQYGLTFWLGDPDRTDEKAPVGIRFPVPHADPARMQTAQVDVFLEPNKHVRRPVAAEPHFAAYAANDYGVYTIEMRLPLGNAIRSELGVHPDEEGTYLLTIRTGQETKDSEIAGEDRDDDRSRGSGMPGSGFDSFGNSAGRLGEGPGLRPNLPLDLILEIRLPEADG